MERLFHLVYIYWLCHGCQALSVYHVDDSVGLGRRYDGIGGLSGGSATSKLLKAYPEKQRNEVLDYLFKPNFAASLQILKVEIGGDSQASDATEASHMHNSWDENYQRGYEWWLMGEAKKRNPNITLYGLPWNFPGWIGNGTQNPYNDPQVLATYIRKWIQGARDSHNLTIDLIGIWNEKRWDNAYIKILREVLDKEGFTHVRIVAADGFLNGIENDIIKDSALARAVDYIGFHYPGTITTIEALETGKQLWSSEDYSSFNDNIGGGCWARILNQNYVNGFMTSTIAWNLIDSYYEHLAWDRDSLMTARQPWSGNYIVESPIWMSAHTTQFTQIGWSYLKHGSGAGHFDQGGSYVSLISPDRRDLTIVIETMTYYHSTCIRPRLLPYNVSSQTVTLDIGGSFANVTQLITWYSRLGFNGTQSTFFKQLTPIKVINGKLNLTLGLDEVYTLTTLTTGQKGDYGTPPAPNSFPLPYMEDFESYDSHAEPLLMAQQNGAFEVISVGGMAGNVMRQMVLQTPIIWCPDYDKFKSTMNLLGSANWSDIYIQTEVIVSKENGTDGVYVAARIKTEQNGCEDYRAEGIFFFLYPVNASFILSQDIGRNNIIQEGNQTLSTKDGWNEISLQVQGDEATGYINGEMLFNISVATQSSKGFVAVGTDVYGLADFDNVKVANSKQEADQLKGKSNRYHHPAEKAKSRTSDTLFFKPSVH